MRPTGKIAAIVFGGILFGIIMSVRDMTPNILLRTFVAGIAGGILGTLLVLARK